MCLVNNASTFECETIETASRDTWDQNIGGSLCAPFILTQAMAAQELTHEFDTVGEPIAVRIIANLIDQHEH